MALCHDHAPVGLTPSSVPISLPEPLYQEDQPVLIAMYFFRKNYKLHDYITDGHFEKMGRLLALVMFVYLYFNINEFLVPAYKLKTAEAITLYDLFTGRFAFLFWAVQIGGLILPIILLLFRKMRTPLPLLIIALAVFTGSWFKRYLL